MADQAVTTTAPRLPTPAPGSVRSLLQSAAVQKRFEQALGSPHKAGLFVAALSTLVYGNRQLQECEPNSVIAAALEAATLDLPVTPALGLAHIIAYGRQAHFQPGWRAYVQLAHRTNQYVKLNVTEVYAGEYRGENRLTGDLLWGERTGGDVVGYAAYFRLVTGFEKAIYWPVERIRSHGERYSKTYARADSRWKTDFDDMARKTVIKQLLTKWGPMSVEMQRAAAADTPPEDEPPGEPGNRNGAQRAADNAALYGKDEPEPGAPAAGEVDYSDPDQVTAAIERDRVPTASETRAGQAKKAKEQT